MNTQERLHQAVAAACPILGVSVGTFGVSASVAVRFDPSATPAQRAAAQAAVDAFDWSDALTLRAGAKAALDAPAEAYALLRAVVLVLVDEIDLLRRRCRDQDAAVAAATTLADHKTRWAGAAAANPMPDRTGAQARAAIKNHLDAGDADS